MGLPFAIGPDRENQEAAFVFAIVLDRENQEAAVLAALFIRSKTKAAPRRRSS
jgi:hypothetical protein